MTAVHRIAAIYLSISALAVLVHFIFSPFYQDSVDVGLVWDVLDAVMAVGILAMLAYTYVHKLRLADDASTVAQACACTVLYASATLALLFFWNWFDDLVSGGDQSATRNIFWPVINTLYILLAGSVGKRLWRNADSG